MDGADFAGHFRHDAGNGGESVCVEGGNCLEIGLGAGAGTVVRACDGEDHGGSGSLLHEAKVGGDTRFWPIISNTLFLPAMVFRELQGLRVSVDRVLYRPDVDAPADRPYAFAYYITIHNDAEETVTIKGRKWVVTDANGQRVVVEGDGVAGECPRLRKGEQFSYHSHHVIGTDSYAEGAYIGVTEEGEAVITRIPRFDMRVPGERMKDEG
jgi:ApaG protein